MPSVLSISHAKAQLPELVRQASQNLKVYRVGNARQRDAKTSVILGEEMVQAILENIKCHPVWEEDSETRLWSVVVPELDVFGQGETREQAAQDLLATVNDYVQLYLEDAPFYFKVGRKEHLPYVLALAFHGGDADSQLQILGL